MTRLPPAWTFLVLAVLWPSWAWLCLTIAGFWDETGGLSHR